MVTRLFKISVRQKLLNWKESRKEKKEGREKGRRKKRGERGQKREEEERLRPTLRLGGPGWAATKLSDLGKAEKNNKTSYL